MKKLIIIAIAAAALAGCMSITVKDYGYEVVRDANGAPMVDKNGVVQMYHKGQRWSYFKHWVNQTSEEFFFSRKPGDDISFGAKNYKDEVSAELNKLVGTSFKGAAELAAKVGAAIATYGATTAGEAGLSALAKAIGNYCAKGGDVANAAISCKDGNCTITDGTITETCTDCLTNCTTGACNPK